MRRGWGAFLEDSAGIFRIDPISFVYCCDYSVLGFEPSL